MRRWGLPSQSQGALRTKPGRNVHSQVMGDKDRPISKSDSSLSKAALPSEIGILRWQTMGDKPVGKIHRCRGLAALATTLRTAWLPFPSQSSSSWASVLPTGKKKKKAGVKRKQLLWSFPAIFFINHRILIYIYSGMSMQVASFLMLNLHLLKFETWILFLSSPWISIG